MGQQRTRTKDGSVRMWDGSLEWDGSPKWDGSAKYPLLAQLKGWVFFLSFSGWEFGEDVLQVECA